MDPRKTELGGYELDRQPCEPDAPRRCIHFRTIPFENARQRHDAVVFAPYSHVGIEELLPNHDYADDWRYQCVAPVEKGLFRSRNWTGT